MEKTNEIKTLLSGYYRWLCDNTIVNYDKSTDWFAVSTPFVGLFNDHIEIYIKKEGDKLWLSDDGETLWNLEMSGVNVMKSPTRKKIIKSIELNFGVKITDGEIHTEATTDNFFNRKHALLQAIQQVSDLRMTAKSDIVSMFSEDLKLYMEEKDVFYTPQFTLVGKSGLNFMFDFQTTGKKEETVIRTYNSLKQSNVTDYLFGIGDVRDERELQTGKKLNCLAVINDTERQPKKDYLDALREYSCTPLLWSQKGITWDENNLRNAG